MPPAINQHRLCLRFFRRTEISSKFLLLVTEWLQWLFFNPTTTFQFLRSNFDLSTKGWFKKNFSHVEIEMFFSFYFIREKCKINYLVISLFSTFFDLFYKKKNNRNVFLFIQMWWIWLLGNCIETYQKIKKKNNIGKDYICYKSIISIFRFRKILDIFLRRTGNSF